MSQFRFLKYDLYRYFYPNNQISERSLIEKMKIILFTQGIWATIVYRYRRWCQYELKTRPLRKLLVPVGSILHLLVEITTGIHIRPEIDIGPGFYIGHYGCIFLGENTKIGKFFNISQECTIGLAGRGERWGLPVIGDFAFMAAGAKAIGKIRIGNHVAIGTNSVVTKDLPDNAVAVGIPAKIISYAGSKDFVLFNEEKNKEIL
jgi:serine O-acetyltransferase